MVTAYQLLGIHEKASKAEILRAYRKAMLRYHPDRNAGINSQAKARQLNRAKDLLTEPEKRARYDEYLEKTRQRAASISCDAHGAGSTADTPEARSIAEGEDQPSPNEFSWLNEVHDTSNDEAQPSPSAQSFGAKRSTTRNRRRKKRRTIPAFVSVPLGGLAGLLIGWLLLKVFFGVDPWRTTKDTLATDGIGQLQTERSMAASAKTHGPIQRQKELPNRTEELTDSTIHPGPTSGRNLDASSPSAEATNELPEAGWESEPQKPETNLTYRLIDLIKPFTNNVSAANSTGTTREGRMIVPINATKVELGVVGKHDAPDSLGGRHAGKFGWIVVNGVKIASCGRGSAVCTACRELPNWMGYDITNLVKPGDEVVIAYRHRQMIPWLGIRLRVHFGGGVTQKPLAANGPDPAAANEADVPKERLTIPNNTVLNLAIEEVDSIFEIPVSKSLDDRKAGTLARSLFQAAQTEKDEVRRYVLLRRTLEIASSAGILDLSRSALSVVCSDYLVDEIELALQTFNRVAKKVVQDDQYSIIFDVSQLIEQAVRLDRLESAKEGIALGYEIARVMRDGEVLKQFNQFRDQVDALTAFLTAHGLSEKDSMDALHSPPTSEQVGKYLCFAKCDWEKGLLKLANCEDESLRTIVQTDISDSFTPLTKGQRWLDYARDAEPQYTKASLARARYWLCDAIKDSQGIERRKVLSDLKIIKEMETKGPFQVRVFHNSIGMRFCDIPWGHFVMGSEAGEANETPSQAVVITSGFYMGTFEVTQRAFEKVMGFNPSKFKDAINPVDSVTLQAATLFCEKLTELRQEQIAGNSYRLPTEAEWEFACRAGTDSVYFFSDDARNIFEHAWAKENAENISHPVGMGKSNRYGLHDILGNVHEWTSDYLGDYEPGLHVDPKGAVTGSIRGGGWNSVAKDCRPSWRGPVGTERALPDRGFRVILQRNSLAR